MTATTLNGVLLFGTAAARPAASAVAKGTLYSATDTGAITQSDGVSTWSAWASVGSGFTNPMTTAGDIIYSSSGSTAARLAASSTNRILTSAGFSTAPYWGQGALASTGDIMLGNNNGTPTRLASGASTFVLTSLGVGVNPAWQASTGGGGGGGTFHGARVQGTGTQTITTGTETILTFTATDIYDTDAYHDTSTNTGRMTIPTGQDGKYVAVAQLRWSTASAAGLRYSHIKLNNTTYVGSLSNGGDQTDLVVTSGPLDLVATDYLEFRVNQQSGGNLNVDGSAIPYTFSIWKVG